MAVAADGNEQIEKNKFGIGIDFNTACDNFISDLKKILDNTYKINEF